MENFDNSTREMLEVVRAEKRKIQQRLAKLEEREKTILGWMAEENPQQQSTIDEKRPRIVIKPRLENFLRDIISDGKPRSNAELAELAKAKGIVPEDVDLRSINSRLLGFMRANLVQRQNGKWIARK